MSLDDVQVHLVDSFEEAQACVKWLEAGTDPLAVDTETHGLRPHHDPVRLLQVGDDRTAWVFPIELPRSWGGFVVELLERLKLRRRRVICHNLKFDQRMIRRWLRHEFDLTQLDDTMLMSRVLEPTRSAALKRLAGTLVDPRAASMDATLHEAMKTSGYGWGDVPIDFSYYWFYAGVDCILTRRVYDQLAPRIEAECPQAYQLELVAANVCGHMEDHGVKIDVHRAKTKHDELMTYVDDVGKWCQSEYGVNPGQNAKVIEVLQDAGHTFTTLTRGGSLALDKEVLSAVDHPLAHAVLSRRQAQKVARTYLRHFAEEVDGDDRLHPSINTCEARTGRMSMSEPNFQNLPRTRGTSPFADIVRSCVVPEEGNVLFMCDFAQIEWRIFASLTQDPELIAAFEADDFFAEMTRQIFNDPSITKDDPRRQIVKNAMYARIFGAGTAKFAWTAGITEEDAKQFTAMLDLKYPAIRRLQQSFDAQGRHHYETEGIAYLTGPLFGRRFVLDDDAIYKLVNYTIQGTAAEVMKLKLIQLAQAGLERYLVIPVHDEVMVEAPREDAVEIGAAIHDVMNDDSMFAVPLTAEMSVGLRWSEKMSYGRGDPLPAGL